MENRTEAVLKIFTQISSIPRRSGNREPISTWIKEWAEKFDFSYKSDPMDNILISIPASLGRENDATFIIQGHSDMVCEKETHSTHDFDADPLELYRDGEWLRARETTLGADNGIALAIAFDLAINPKLSHPAFDILVTSDEEIGLDGANALSDDFLKGGSLINLDSEDEGVFTVGCAGGVDCTFDFVAEPIQTTGDVIFLTLSGLCGGHSGVDIDKNRGSAIKLMARMLSSLPSYKLISIDSGSGASNAISRQAECQFLLGSSHNSHVELEQWLDNWKGIFAGELAEDDPHLSLVLERGGEGHVTCLSEKSSKRLISLLEALPHGALAHSRELDGLVETSSNLAAVKNLQPGLFHIVTSQRSSVSSRLKEVNSQVEAVARLGGCINLSTKNKYPPWQPNWESPLLSKAKELYGNLFKREPIVEVIHAGLETGVIGAKYPNMDMISLGPTIKNPHSPDEKLLIPTVGLVYRLMCEFMQK